MKVKRFKTNIPETIIGMTLENAKMFCLSEGYVLQTNDNPISDKELSETYLITVNELDSDGKILRSKYGK
jgi:hypothetical protein